MVTTNPFAGASSSRWLTILAVLLLIVVVLFAGYTWTVLNWSYSSGERAGYVQKFSHKGWVCKTWEGELAMVSMPGTLAEKFLFTVRNNAVADKINRSMGKRVALVYEEHVGIPTNCFGDTGHFVVDVKEVQSEFTPAPSPPTSAVPPSVAPANNK